MLIKEISARKFAKYDELDVVLPRQGLVLVTGKNGHGKSSLVEAVSQALWNVSIRGEPGWRIDEKSGVRVTFDGGHVNRAVAKSSQTLRWAVGDEGAAVYPTRTKSQEALESHIGTYNVWRHACVFHTKDASVFTEATDAERKRLLEDVLELSRVEVGYRKARDEAQEAKRVLSTCRHQLQLAEGKVSGLREQQHLMSGELESVPDIAALRRASVELKGQIDASNELVDAATRAATAARDEYFAARHEVAEITKRIEKLVALTGVCRVCEQPINLDNQAAHLDEANDALTKAEAWVQVLEQAAGVAARALAEARADNDVIRQAFSANVTEGKSARAVEARNAERATKLTGIVDKINEAEAEVSAATETVRAAELYAQALEAATTVLSYQGARASILTAAVAGLQDLANTWLGRLGLNDLSVTLSSQSSSQTGKVSDKISFDVHGAGGGRGYAAASTGEQRRIDIAMLFAIGELACVARGLSAESTLFVDELFDGLDEEGTSAAVAMLQEVSANRCVVVITHSDRLVTALAPSVHFIAQDGTLTGK